MKKYSSFEARIQIKAKSLQVSLQANKKQVIKQPNHSCCASHKASAISSRVSPIVPSSTGVALTPIGAGPLS